MKNFCISILLAITLCPPVAIPQEKGSISTVDLIQLLASPEKFEGKKVQVRGFVVILRDPRHLTATLFLHEEDAKHRLGNSVNILGSEQMIRDEEKINNVYVRLIGKVQVIPTTSGARVVQIRDVESCDRWPPPELRK